MGVAPPLASRIDPDPDHLTGSRVRGRLAPEAMFPAGLAGYRVRFEMLASGERIRVIELGPEDGQPVVFIGGWACSVWDHHLTYPAMAAAGYRAIGVDLRGHGLSDMPEDSALYTTDAMVAHLIDVLDVLGVAHPAIVGHSMGGALGVHVALRAPGRVGALVLVSSIGFGVALPPTIGRVLARRWIVRAARFLLRRPVVAVGLRILYCARDRVDAQNVDEYWAPSQFTGFVPAMRALLERFRWSPFTPEELSRIVVPCLLVRGGRDPIIRRPKEPVRLPPGSRELLIEEAGHLPHDEAPDRVNQALLEFLSSTFAAKADHS